MIQQHDHNEFVARYKSVTANDPLSEQAPIVQCDTCWHMLIAAPYMLEDADLFIKGNIDGGNDVRGKTNV